MAIQNIPDIYLDPKNGNVELFVYDFKMTDDVVKTKVNLGLHMFSFLQTGKKQVHFADTSVAVNKNQSLLIKKGNCLWTELLDREATYYCKLLFFTEDKLKNFLQKHSFIKKSSQIEAPYFAIKNDAYILAYLDSLSSLSTAPPNFIDNLLSIKFEELMLYLINKYGQEFEMYLHSLISKTNSTFNSVIENNLYSNLKLEEIAFLCNMSLSTFKRHFTIQYKTSPGKWLQDKRLQRAKDMLEEGNTRASDIYLDFGYNNLSNFSAAFKSKFGINPTETH